MTEHGPRGSRIDDILATIDNALADPGQHSPETTMYLDVAMPMPDEATCWRCETGRVAYDSTAGLCDDCREYLLDEETTAPTPVVGSYELWRDQIIRRTREFVQGMTQESGTYGSAYGPYLHESRTAVAEMVRRAGQRVGGTIAALGMVAPAISGDVWRAAVERLSPERMVQEAMRAAHIDRDPVRQIELRPDQFRAIATLDHWPHPITLTCDHPDTLLFGVPVRVNPDLEYGFTVRRSGEVRPLPSVVVTPRE